VLVITFHVFVFIVLASIDSGSAPTLLSAGGVLARPNIFFAGAVHGIGRLLLSELPFADWAGFGHYVGHDLVSCLIGIKFFGYHNVVFNARECAKATCRLISAAACVRRLPFAIWKSRVVTLCSQKVHLNVVLPFIGLVV
jgi:hypothetical protein